MSNLTQRIISGLIYGVVSIACISLSSISYVLFFFIVMLIGLNEFYKLIDKLGFKINRVLTTISSILFFLTALSFYNFTEYTKLFLALSIFSILVIFIRALFQKENNSFSSVSSSLISIFYIALPFTLTYLIAF